ncbi:MAG: DUF2807 domain-containing protein [Candidatus Kapaibacterium sp.]|nr:MAG: DUF2807 domain-containing protein [Candidatus Kapabacteria bacterium]
MNTLILSHVARYSRFILPAMMLALGALPAFAQFWGGGTRGSGKILSDTRTVPAFTKIIVAGSGDVVFKKGDKREVIVEADDNIWESVQTDVSGNGELVLGMKSGSWNNMHLKFIITNPTLEAAQIRGSGSMEIENSFEGQKLFSEISGSGSLRYKGGKVQQHEISINGSGSVLAEKLDANDVEVSIAGSGSAKVMAQKTLNARISGSGSVVYSGTASVNKSIFGSGSVVKR